jgi:replicative DNA helicase
MPIDFMDEKPKTADAVTASEIGTMISGLIRHPSLLRDSLRVGLTHSHFGQSIDELPFYYLFAAMKELHDQFGALTADMINTRLLAWRDSAAAGFSALALNNNAIEALISFVNESFNVAALAEVEARAEKSYIEDIVRRFIRERMIKGEAQAVLNTLGGAPENLEAQLAQWTKKAQSVDALGKRFENAAMMPDIGEPIALPPVAVPTTLPFIDEYLQGFRAGDIIGVLGPYGGGKTTLLAVTAVRMAQQYAATSPNKLSVFIGYEDPAEKMNPTFWSAAAQIDRSLFAAGRDFWSELSTTDNLKDYDRELPVNRNGDVMFGERERWIAASSWFNNNFMYLDFSQNEKTGNRGAGGVTEIVVALEQLARERGMEIGFVAIDYCGVMVEREMNANVKTKYSESLARPIKNAVDQLRARIAVPSGAVIMLAHQLAQGEVKSIPPYRYVSHADASGSKSFAENLHACICVNARDEACHVSTIYWSKLRYLRADNLKGLIKIDDRVAEIRLVNDEYTASEAAKRIIQRGDIAPVTPEEAAALTRPRAAARRIIPVDTFAEDMMS